MDWYGIVMKILMFWFLLIVSTVMIISLPALRNPIFIILMSFFILFMWFVFILILLDKL